MEANLQTPFIDSPLVELFVIDCTGLGGPIHRFTPHFSEGASVSFGGNTYLSMPIISDGWEVSASGTQPRPTLSLTNVNRLLMNEVVTLGDLVGAKITRIRTLAKYLDAASFPRRNLLNYSEQFNNVSWTKNASCTITANSAESPLGSLTADTLVVSAPQGGFFNVSTAGTNSTTYTASIYAKPGSLSSLKFGLTNQNESATLYCNYDLNVGVAAGVSGAFTSGKPSMINVGGGWWRCVMTGTSPSSGMTGIGIYPRLVVAGSVYLWGAQLELGSVATDYQHTTTSHQPFADQNAFLKPDVFEVEQKINHTSEVIQWQLSSVIDRFGTKLPRRQITRDKFPGVGRQRGAW